MNLQAAPPGILDLIPWGPSPPPPPHEDATDLHPHIWSHLPDNLLHSILPWLPFQSVLRFRCVCKQWKALFASPTFHHFASHRAYVPPLIFFIRSCKFLDGDTENGNAINHFDEGYDDKGYVYEDVPDGNGSDESTSDDSDEDSHDADGYVHKDLGHGDSHSDGHFMGGHDHGYIPVCMSYINFVNMRDNDHADVHDLSRYRDHGDMYDVIKYEDPRDMHDGIGLDDYGAILDVDDKDNRFSIGQANDQEVPKEHTNIEPLLLIFDCESESWRRPLALPPTFRRSLIACYHVSNFQEQLLIRTNPPCRFFLFNPASPPCKELPPCIAIQNLEALGFVEEMATLPGAVTSSNNFVSMSNEEEPPVQDKTLKFLQVVAVGDTIFDTNIVESYDSVTGSWHVIGRLPQSEEFIFEQRRMIYCKGCFYAVLCSGILMMSNVLVGQNMEWKIREFPHPPNRDDGESRRHTELVEQSLVATRESVFLVGVAVTDIFKEEVWDVLIWQFHPHAPADACWELHAYVPSRILEAFIDDHVSNMQYSAHEDLIFFNVPGRWRFLIYDVPQKLWRFSAKCKYSLDILTFVWEPLLRNQTI